MTYLSNGAEIIDITLTLRSARPRWTADEVGPYPWRGTDKQRAQWRRRARKMLEANCMAATLDWLDRRADSKHESYLHDAVEHVRGLAQGEVARLGLEGLFRVDVTRVTGERRCALGVRWLGAG